MTSSSREYAGIYLVVLGAYESVLGMFGDSICMRIYD
jgi:hypothetical protein